MSSCNRRKRRRTSYGSDSHRVEPVYWYSIFSLLSFGKKIVKRLRPAGSVPVEPVQQSSISVDERRITFGSGPDPVEPSHWSSIPGDILCVIAGKIGSVDDYVRFCAVCRYWYSTATGFYDMNRFGPLLVMSGPKPKSTRVTLRNPSSDSTFLLDLPTAPKTLRWGSPFGWLISYDPDDLRISLLNPFTGDTIALPRYGSGNPDPFGPPRDPQRAFLTADPMSDPEDCLVIVSRRFGHLSFVRPMGLTKEWCQIEWATYLQDVASFRGKLYGIQSFRSHHIELLSFRLNHRESNGQISHRLTVTLTPDTAPDPVNSLVNHIVEINGDLCLCVRYPAPAYKIFKIDIPNGNFTQIYLLAEHCLFLGQGYSFACKASYSPGEFFLRPRRPEPRELASNYVFYIRNERRLNIDFWDVSRSEMARATRDWLQGSFLPLWIVPSIKFRKLEEDMVCE